ncbi:cytochrome P450 [Patulibacter sp. S7RM1-6]
MPSAPAVPAPPTVAAAPPAPIETRVSRAIPHDVGREVRARRRGRLPAGSLRPSARNTWRGLADPLGLLLEHHERHGPVFTIRMLHEPIVWVLGAEATHQVLVSEADAFSWREGRFRDLAPLLGDGMLNIDGDYHRDLRRLMLPAFHHRQVAAAADTVVAEAVRAAGSLRIGERVDVYAWTREVALRIAMRALLGLRAGEGREARIADAFARALAFHGIPFALQALRGPGTPDARAQRARRELRGLVRDEIADRRARGEDGDGVIGMLLAARTAAGDPLPVAAVRDQLVTLLFAGHDTTTATLTFLLYELGRNGDARAAVVAELADVLGGAPPTPADLDGRRLPVLERTLQETLRRYPPAWVGPRRTVRDVTIAGHALPAGIGVHYSSWATHHLPELWDDPLEFRPDRFLPDAVAARPKGAYVPFGGGSRICLGKRFGELELRALAATLLGRFRFEVAPVPALRISTTPTLGPADGLRCTVRPAEVAA